MLEDASKVEADFLDMHYLLKEDALKMYQVMIKLSGVKNSSLIAPNNLPANQAHGYASGSKDAFQRVGGMADFVLQNLNYDFERLLSEENPPGASAAKQF